MTATTDFDEDRRDALVERLFGSFIGSMELLTIELGQRLGLYAALQDGGPLRADELAERAGITPRYACEWLEQQAAAHLIDVVEEGDATTRRYALPAAHAPTLLDPDDVAFVGGLSPALVGCALTLPAVARAYRSGAGVPYADFGAEIRNAVTLFNRPMYANDLANWLALLPETVTRLHAGGRVLDVACGTGWSSVALARAFPEARVRGVDLDRASIDEARVNAKAAGVDDRVTFEVADVAGLAGPGERYDLVTLFEALHDMGDPVGALRRVRAVLADGAPLVVADERVADEFHPPTDEVERMNYAFSVLHCLPATMAESTEVASGTVLRAPTVRRWGTEAGFRSVEELPIEHDLWRFYRFDA
jgi:ubiquinone/menaquinone biosynthesis C-methylase UbiE